MSTPDTDHLAVTESGEQREQEGAAVVRDLEILQHSLGLDKYGRGSEYRNRFVTGPDGADFPVCSALEERGLMRDMGAISVYGGMHYFVVTDEGRAYVKTHSAKSPTLTRSQQRYQDFLDADSGMTFREWLSYRTTESRPGEVSGCGQQSDDQNAVKGTPRE